MAGQIVRLKLALMANAFRRSVWQTILFVIGALSALGGVVVAVGATVIGVSLSPVIATQVLIIAGAVAVGAWLVVPILMFGLDATLDPHRFMLYPIPLRQLMAGMALAGLISVPGAATALAMVGVAFAWWRNPLALLAALVGAAAAVALCFVGSRALTTWLSPLLERRRARELLALVLILPLMLAGPIIGFITERAVESGADGASAGANLRTITNVIGWTPLGAPWSVPAAVVVGDWLGALARLAILIATVALAWFGWRAALAKSLETPREQVTAASRVTGAGLFNRFPATPRGAVAARAATYWLRDPRYSASLIVLPLLPFVFLLGSQAGDQMWAMAIALAPMTGWILGFSIANDIAMDYTAFALHVTTGVSGRADRLGRALPLLIAGVPLVALYSVLSVWVAHRWFYLPAVLGLGLSALLGTLGISLATSARFVYPAQKPGESPFKQPQGATGATMLAQGAVVAMSGLFALPTLGLGLWAIIASNAVAGWLTLIVGVVIGVVVLWLGARLGAKWYETRAPELLQKLHSFT